MKCCARWPLCVQWVLNVSTWCWYRKDACWGVSLDCLGCFLKLTLRELLCNLTWLFLSFASSLSQFFWMRRWWQAEQQTFSLRIVSVLLWMWRCLESKQLHMFLFVMSFPLPFLFLHLSLSLSGLQLVCECQEATEEHGEAARSELGAQDQALQQICSGQRGEAERQQRRQLLRRYGSSVDFFSLPKFHFKVRRGLCPAENSQSCPDHSSTTKMGNCPAGPDLHRLFT